MHALHTQIRKYSGETEKGTYIYLTLSVSYRLSNSRLVTPLPSKGWATMTSSFRESTKQEAATI